MTVTERKLQDLDGLIEYLFQLYLKGELCSFGEEIQIQDFIIYNINEEIIWTLKCFCKSLSE